MSESYMHTVPVLKGNLSETENIHFP